MIDDALLRVLACPGCKGEISQDEEEEFLICFKCKLKYPVIEGIPVMLADEAHPLAESDDGGG